MENLELKLYSPFDKPSFREKNHFVNFLHEHLATDNIDKQCIRKSIDYAMREIMAIGGFVVALSRNRELLGVCVLNKTGMGGYMPDYVLPYMAVKPDVEDAGDIRRLLLRKSVELCDGDVAYHTIKDCPSSQSFKEQGFNGNRIQLVFSKSEGQRIGDRIYMPQGRN